MTAPRSINEWARLAFEGAAARGFHGEDNPACSAFHMDPQRIASRIALIHSELSKALEEVTRGRMWLWHTAGDDVTGPAKPEGFGVELADVFIRLVDLAYSTGVDLEAMIDLKFQYNAGRPIMHGGKRL